jgi:hypothetical protein
METTIVRKGFTPQKAEVNAKERSRVVRITPGAVDRDGEVLRPDGGEFDQYLANPVVLFAHDYQSIPVGKCVSLKTDSKGVIAKTVYNNTRLANEIYQLAADGFPLAVSVGFLPAESAHRGDSGFQAQLDECVMNGWVKKSEAALVRRIYSKWILLEYSDVPVPANPEALQLAISKGWVKPKSGRVLSAENQAHLEKALDHHAECGRRIKAVLKSQNGSDAEDDDEPVPARAGSSDEDEAEEKSVTADQFREILAEGMTELVAHRVKTAGNELLTMIAMATGKHIEL